jgi:hypothetical protein
MTSGIVPFVLDVTRDFEQAASVCHPDRGDVTIRGRKQTVSSNKSSISSDLRNCVDGPEVAPCFPREPGKNEKPRVAQRRNRWRLT